MASGNLSFARALARLVLRRTLSLGWLLASLCRCSAAELPPIYLADAPDLLLAQTQGWGELGYNTAAHAPGQAGLPLQVGTKTFPRGLGHHAPGRLTVALDGQFKLFAAEVGLHPCGGGGSVVFRVKVDGETRFESGVRRATDPAQPIQVGLEGAQEMTLEADDAGDGITCDMANWLEARLTPAVTGAAAAPARVRVDIAPFAQLIAPDPTRTNGCTADRLQEFVAEDLDLDPEARPQRDGSIVVPAHPAGLAGVGLKWLHSRALVELGMTLAPGTTMVDPAFVRVQRWVGESAWQGHWVDVAGTCVRVDGRLVFRPGAAGRSGMMPPTRKIRWVLPVPSGSLTVRALTAFTRSRWDELAVRIEADPASPNRPTQLRVFNGEVCSLRPEHRPGPGRRSHYAAGAWEKLDLSQPVLLVVRHSRASAHLGDGTVLQFQSPHGGVGVAVKDLLQTEGVYLPSAGLFVTRAGPGLTLAQYRERLTGRSGILEKVRERPDQTLEQAMRKTHHEAQSEGPVMLSLSCANTKYVVEREGSVRFQPIDSAQADWMGAAAALQVVLGDGGRDRFERRLEGGWLPIPVITTERAGAVLDQRVFVAPSRGAGEPRTGEEPAVCVVEYTLRNVRTEPTAVRLAMALRGPGGAGLLPWTMDAQDGWVARPGDTEVFLAPEEAAPLTAHLEDRTCVWSGQLPVAGQARLVVFLHRGSPRRWRVAEVADRRQAMEQHWRQTLAPAAQIETPDPWLNDILRSSQVRCLIAARHEAAGERVAAWIAAMAYGPLESEAHSVIRGMDFLGHHDFARRSLDYFIHRYNTNGFLTTGYTTFGTAWHLWTVGEHVALTDDQPWVRRHASEWDRVGQWILRQLAKTRRWDAQGRPRPGYGLMPPAVMADWNAFAMHFMLNGYYHAALRELGATLTPVSGGQAKVYRQAAARLRADTRQAYRQTQSQSPALPLRDGTWIPHYPSQVHSPGPLAEFFPGDDAGRSWAYDVELGAHQLAATGVFSPQEEEVMRLLGHMEDVHFLGDGWFDYAVRDNERDWFNLGGFAKVQPFYARTVELHALRDDVKPFLRSYWNGLASLLNPEVLTLWEHFHHSGAWDKTHETGYFLHQTRLMLVQERGRELWLAPFMPSDWLAEGKRLSVRQAPTRFGPVDYQIVSHAASGWVELTVTPPTRRPADRLVVRLRDAQGRSMREVEVNGKRWGKFDAAKQTITLPSSPQPLRVKAMWGP